MNRCRAGLTPRCRSRFVRRILDKEAVCGDNKKERVATVCHCDFHRGHAGVLRKQGVCVASLHLWGRSAWSPLTVATQTREPAGGPTFIIALPT